MTNLEWEVGDSYYVIEGWNRIWGTIMEIKDGKYKVRWKDGRVTIEDEPDPACGGHRV